MRNVTVCKSEVKYLFKEFSLSSIIENNFERSDAYNRYGIFLKSLSSNRKTYSRSVFLIVS